MTEIFLSYSRNDQEFAERLTQNLKEHGIPVWVDTQEIQGGDAWRAAISRAIAECDAFLVILSPQCVASKNVVKELSIAESKERHIIPVMYQKCEIPDAMQYQLAGLQWIDFSAMTFEAAVDRLIKVLQHGKPTWAVAATATSAASDTPQSVPPQPPAGPSPVAPSQFPPPSPVQPLQSPGEPLNALLCGRWNVQVAAAGIVFATLVLDLSPNGTFSGQRVSQMEGLAMVRGMWQLAPTGQLVLQGQQGNQWAAAPFTVITQFSQVSPTTLVGISSAGEQVVWAKVPV